jgi:excinuclease ABC subunit C
MANRNAAYCLEERMRSDQKKTTELEILQSTLNLPNYPNRIECIDISNMQETAIVASNVCFIEGRPAKEFYRKYNIESVKDKPDDFASIHEVVLRRLKRAETEQDLPDLLLIDGGKGQLNAAIEAAKQFPNLAVCILSLAKSRHGKRDALNHDGGGIKSQERIFFPERELPLNLDPGSPCYRILTQIRDEAHRFAITFHRKKRSSLLHRSILDQVPGIGPALKKRLFEIYPSLDHMGKASMIELLTIRGMTKEKAAALRSILAQYQETLGE